MIFVSVVSLATVVYICIWPCSKMKIKWVFHKTLWYSNGNNYITYPLFPFVVSYGRIYFSAQWWLISNFMLMLHKIFYFRKIFLLINFLVLKLSFLFFCYLVIDDVFLRFWTVMRFCLKNFNSESLSFHVLQKIDF